MPHVKIKYINNLDLDLYKVFDSVEKVINQKPLKGAL